MENGKSLMLSGSMKITDLLIRRLVLSLLMVLASQWINAQSVLDKFLEKIISTDLTESSLTINSDSTELFFVRSNSFYTASQKVIYHSTKSDDTWSEPKIAWFSGQYSDTSPFLTYDNNYLYFISTRPVKKKQGERKDKDIWRIEKKNGVWGGDPEHLGDVVNSSYSEYSPSLDSEGNLYFGSLRDSLEWGNIFVAYKMENRFMTPIPLPPPINSNGGEWGSCISKDGNWLVFEASGREENLSSDGDLYLANRSNSGDWSIHHMTINSSKSDLTPKFLYLKNDTVILLFASNRNDQNVDSDDVDIYSCYLGSLD